MLKYETNIEKLNFLHFLKLKKNYKKFKILQKLKKKSSYIHPRNIPTDFENNPNIGCRVTEVDRQTEMRHGKNVDLKKHKFYRIGKSINFTE